MAKKETKKTGTGVATRRTGTEVSAGLPAHLKTYESQGKGLTTGPQDVLIPMARILQANSPEVLKGSPNRIPGAEAGDIFIKGAPSPIIKADDGFLFQPCHTVTVFVEWIPRAKGGGGGGGFVESHPAMPKDCVQIPHPNDPERKIWARGPKAGERKGNWVVETRQHTGCLINDDGEPMPLVIPFSSSGHTVAKQWNMLTGSKRINGEAADLWLCIYKLTSRSKTKNDNTWSIFEIKDAGPEDEETGLPTTMWVPTAQDVERGAAIYETMERGARQADFASGNSAEAD